jgi:hypothetical protein
MKHLKNLLGLLALGTTATCGLVLRAAEVEQKFEINEQTVTLTACPAAVQKAIRREAMGATINEVLEDTHDCTTIYRAEVTLDGKKYDVIAAEDGTLIEKVLSQDDDEDDESVEVAFSGLPSAVRRTIKREAHGVKIATATKETHCGKTLYEVDVNLEGKNYEIKVAESGTLISKVLDEEEDTQEKDTQEKDKVTPITTLDKNVSHEERSTPETEPLMILRADNVTLFEGPELGRKVGLMIEGKNFEIKATKSGILISIVPDEDDDENRP